MRYTASKKRIFRKFQKRSFGRREMYWARPNWYSGHVRWIVHRIRGSPSTRIGINFADLKEAFLSLSSCDLCTSQRSAERRKRFALIRGNCYNLIIEYGIAGKKPAFTSRLKSSRDLLTRENLPLHPRCGHRRSHRTRVRSRPSLSTSLSRNGNIENTRKLIIDVY